MQLISYCKKFYGIAIYCDVRSTVCNSSTTCCELNFNTTIIISNVIVGDNHRCEVMQSIAHSIGVPRHILSNISISNAEIINYIVSYLEPTIIDDCVSFLTKIL